MARPRIPLPKRCPMMKKLLSIVVAALAVGACAFHEDKPRGKTWIPEESDASVGTKQKYQGTVPTYGDVPLNTQVESAPAPTVDPGARENLGAAAEQIDGRQVLDEGRNRTDARSSGGGFSILRWRLPLVGARDPAGRLRGRRRTSTMGQSCATRATPAKEAAMVIRRAAVPRPAARRGES